MIIFSLNDIRFALGYLPKFHYSCLIYLLTCYRLSLSSFFAKLLYTRCNHVAIFSLTLQKLCDNGRCSRNKHS